MPKVTIGLGLVLIILGIVGFVGTGSEHYTALIPAAFGVVFIVLGATAMNAKYLKHAMHGAAMLAVLGFFGTISGVLATIKLMGGATIERKEAALAKCAMSLLCVVFIALCVRSFIAARKAREAVAR